MTSANVNTGFQQFMIHAVRLDSTAVDTARTSRASLLRQIDGLPGTDPDFPLLYSDAHIQFGSFARRTKCRALDDIDQIITMIGGGGWYEPFIGTTCRIYVPDGHRLAAFRDASGAVNSRLVINQFIRSLSAVPLYKKAEMKRNGSAAVLNLTSYSWVYDIVPAFITTEDAYGRSYYLIPDGDGHWMKTDPRIDKSRATTINQEHGGYVLDVVRLVKLWIKRKRGLSLGSYLTEALILEYYSSPGVSAQKYMDLNLRDVLYDMATRINSDVADPKNIDGNINTLTFGERWAASSTLRAAADACRDACNLEVTSQERAIRAWKDILGDDFGEY